MYVIMTLCSTSLWFAGVFNRSGIAQHLLLFYNIHSCMHLPIANVGGEVTSRILCYSCVLICGLLCTQQLCIRHCMARDYPVEFPWSILFPTHTLYDIMYMYLLGCAQSLEHCLVDFFCWVVKYWLPGTKWAATELLAFECISVHVTATYSPAKCCIQVDTFHISTWPVSLILSN